MKYWYALVVSFFVSASVVSAQEVENFFLEDTENEEVTLEDLQGESFTILDFWATWCKPCKKAMPKLNDLYAKYKDQGVNVIGISCDGPRSIGQVSMVAQSLGVDYPILKDIDCEVMSALQLQAFPTLLILDENREVVWMHEGFVSGDELLIEEELSSLLE